MSWIAERLAFIYSQFSPIQRLMASLSKTNFNIVSYFSLRRNIDKILNIKQTSIQMLGFVTVCQPISARYDSLLTNERVTFGVILIASFTFATFPLES
jgi:hypothetical protein